MSSFRRTVLSVAVGAILLTVHYKNARFMSSLQSNNSIDRNDFSVDVISDAATTASSTSLLSSRESFGFFDDIPNDQWLFKKQISHKRLTVVGSASKRVRGYYQSNWNPEFTCGETEMVHTVGQGGHWICDPWRLNKSKNGCVVYSVGFGTVANHNFEFERALKARAPLCDIHVFDHVDYSDRAPSEVLTFHQIGMKGPFDSIFLDKNNRTGVDSFQTLPEMAETLGHEKIDFLSLDLEGWEWSMFKQFTEVDIRQMALMVHGKYNNRLIARKDDRTTETFQMLHDFGYVIHHKEANLAEMAKNIEFSFLKMDPSFRELPA